MVPRPQLVDQLQAGLARKLTLISAPAGFGKSSLMSVCAAQCGRSVAWLSLDRRDNDPARFWAYVITALQTISPGLGQPALERWQQTQSPPGEGIFTELINELAVLPELAVLVLDDFHVIEAEPIHEGLIFFLTHLPPSLHLVVCGRADPPWPLARWRARHEINEIRALDLRFSQEETAVFLNQVMSLNLSPDAVMTLDERTEGWPAGLQMAALSLQNRPDPEAFIANFSTSHRFVLDYLIEEVVEQQPSAIQEFLLKTAVLEQMSAPLCQAVTDRADSNVILHQLAQSNLFLVALDDEWRWFRYHHLFADVLANRLQQTWPDALPDLHGRASRWFEEQGQFDEAVTHALAAGDMERAADLVEQCAFDVLKVNREITLAEWLSLLPDEVIRQRPWLCVHHAYINQWVGLREQVELWLRHAEQAAGEPEDTRLIGHIAARRAHWALVTGDVTSVVEQAQKALANLPQTDPWRMTTLVALGGAYWAQGNTRQSEATFAQAATGARQLGDRSVAVLAACYAGLQQEKQGRLVTAGQTYEEALALSARRSGQNIVSVGFPLIRLANLWREWNDLAKAQTYFEEGLAICVAMGQSDVLTDAYIIQARLYLTLGRLDSALAALQQARRVMEGTAVDPWLGCWLDECYLRYWLRIGDWETAVHWGQTSGLTIDGTLSYHHDLHHRNLARLLLVQGQREPDGPYLAQALALLDRLLAAAERAGWVQEEIQVLILQALAHRSAAQMEAAYRALARAVMLARPGGYVRLFVDEGPVLGELLYPLVHDVNGDYVTELMAALAVDGGETAVFSPTYPASSLVDPLSERELDVLRLLPTHLSSTEIAEELFVAPSTVRSHIKNIYSKLNVHSRADAVVRAEALRLLV